MKRTLLVCVALLALTSSARAQGCSGSYGAYGAPPGGFYGAPQNYGGCGPYGCPVPGGYGYGGGYYGNGYAPQSFGGFRPPIIEESVTPAAPYQFSPPGRPWPRELDRFYVYRPVLFRDRRPLVRVYFRVGRGW